MKKRKSMITIEVLVHFAIAVLIVLAVIFILRHLFGEQKDDLDKSLQSTGDYDNDGISNVFDRCTCEWSDQDDGCPSSFSDTDKDNSDCSSCPDDLKPDRCP